MAKNRQPLFSLLLAALIALIPAAALMENFQPTSPPAQKELTIELEGMPETVLVTEHRLEGVYSLWYDAKAFAPALTDQGVKFELIDNQLSGEVSFSVASTWRPDQPDEPALEDFIAAYQGEGWECHELDAAGMLPLFKFPDEPVRGFIASRDRENALVYLTSVTSGSYLCTLRFPNEAAEGWGARMQFMVNSLQGLPGE